MRNEKEERKKQARSNKQTRQSNTAHPHMHCTCMCTCVGEMNITCVQHVCNVRMYVYKHKTCVHVINYIMCMACVYKCMHVWYTRRTCTNMYA